MCIYMYIYIYTYIYIYIIKYMMYLINSEYLKFCNNILQSIS